VRRVAGGAVPAPGLRLALRGLWAYLREVSGESAYDGYVAHVRRAHPDAPVLSRRDFERRRMAERDSHPGSRCC
jgi:uncharacterized short protein YbdD (DUF466 family)